MKNSKMLKRIFAFVLCLCICCSCFVFPANAAKTNSNSNMTTTLYTKYTTMRVFEDIKVEEIYCKTYQYSMYVDANGGYSYLDKLVTKTAEKVKSCSLTVEPDEIFAHALIRVQYADFQGKIEGSSVGKWTLSYTS